MAMSRIEVSAEEKELILMLREWKRDVRGFGSSEVLISRQHGRGWEIRLALNADQMSSIGLSFGLAWNALVATQLGAAR